MHTVLIAWLRPTEDRGTNRGTRTGHLEMVRFGTHGTILMPDGEEEK